MFRDPQPDTISRLLIVDDDQDFAASLAGLLALEGYEVLVAHDIATALTLAPRAAVALVDIRLGRDDGVKLAADMLERDPKLLVVMITAYASVQTAIKALRAGVYDYLCKPFEPDDLLATVGRCFDRLRLVREHADAERRLLLSRRMETIGRLAAAIAHEFNNLLAVVVGNLRLAQEEIARGDQRDEARLKELTCDALDAVADGIAANRRILAIGRAQTLVPRVLDVGKSIEGIARRIERVLAKRIALEVAVPAQTLFVRVDESQLEACLLTLAVNARDADAGHVRLVVREESLGADSQPLTEEMRPGPYACVVVEDDGKGMSPDVAELAMAPFFSTKSTEMGSGIGLSMAYGFARQSGGNLVIDSAEGAGARVTLLLPSLPTAAVEDGPAPHSGESLTER
jgi:signal transduction histidine kinase